MKHFIFSLLLLVLFLTSIAQQSPLKKIDIPLHRDSIRFQVVNDMIIVNVEVAGKVRNFLLDSAAPTLISQELQKELCLGITDSRSITDAGNTTSQMERGILPLLEIGNSKVTNLPVVFFDMSKIEQLACLNIQGFLGFDAFESTMLQIDVKNRKLLIADKLGKITPDERFGHGMKVLAGQNAVLLPVKFDKVFVEDALFDTGMNASLYSVAKKTIDYVAHTTSLDKFVGARGYGASLKVASGTENESKKTMLAFDEMYIGQFKISQPIVASANQPYSLLGVKFLKFGKITFDFSVERYYFEPYEKMNKAEPIKSTGFEFRFEKNEFLVGVVWKDSPAEKFGLRPGFKLLEYGNNNLEKLTADQVCSIMGMNFSHAEKKEKDTLYVKFIDDDGIIKELELPVVDIRSFKGKTK
ncbi:hypothetical protein EZ449_04920 [Pedobacter frigidisoli]|uniref:Aspartyl protease n=1 Tax=Pedobacter frigidisoli TaxID=2530455 RepID=A0A4R0P6S9_9SPHI|nr:aspartyl protease family protein [Pedobacter frigidisoli]TCD11606.1 hypothetical protein EZ449_04920 [Pedobacter frigidisoli]